MINKRIQAILDGAGITEQLDCLPASGGQRNETWICAPYVVRLTHDPAAQLLAHEAHLLQHLSERIPVPAIIVHGSDANGEWMIQEQVVGTPLAHVWGSLDEQRRHAAVSQLAEITQTLHQTAWETLPLQSLPTDWLTATLPTAIQQLAEQSKALENVDEALMNDVISHVQMLAHANLATGTWGLIHGDLHFDNVLWDGKEIVALLDFEKACYAPLALELDLFLRYCAFPALFVTEEFEHLTASRDYRQVPFWLREAYPQLFHTPMLREQLELYSLYYDLRLLQAFPPTSTVDPAEDNHLINRVRAIVEQRGYLAIY